MDKSNDPPDLSIYQSLLSYFSAEVHTAKGLILPQHDPNRTYLWTHTPSNLFQNIQLSPLPPHLLNSRWPSATSSTTKLGQSVASFHHMHGTQTQPHLTMLTISLFAFCPLTEARSIQHFLPSPATLQHTLLIQSPHTFLHANLSFTLTRHAPHIINTSLLTGTFPTAIKQAWVTPLLEKPTLNTSLTDSYRHVSLLPMLDQLFFNQLSSFLSKA